MPGFIHSLSHAMPLTSFMNTYNNIAVMCLSTSPPCPELQESRRVSDSSWYIQDLA